MNSNQDYFIKKLEIDVNQPSPIMLRYSRYHILDLFRELDFKVGAEIGTEHGIYAEKLCSKNSQLKLFCIDPWIASTYYHEETKQEVMDGLYQEAKNRLSKYNCEILKMTSMEAVKLFKLNSLDFVFIDGNHNFEFVKDDISSWSKIVRPGGVVYGHDYWGNNDVKQAVDGFMETSKIKPWFKLHRGGYMIPCWMYFRENR